MKPWSARLVVAVSSGAVLVLEILAGRLLAPYVGVSLETFTGIIGIVLAGIAAGAWAGGTLADQVEPRPLISAAIVAGGLATLLVLPVLDALGNQFGDGGTAIIMLSMTALFVPAALLSAVPPIVAKIALADLGNTGSVIGGLSAAGTIGALFGTFITGFVLVATLPTRPTVIGLGAFLIVFGAVIHGVLVRAMPSVVTIIAIVFVGGLAVVSDGPCEFNTTYFCGSIVVDDDNPTGNSLYLDRARHAYVDLADPANIDVRYVRLFAQVADGLKTGALDSLHIGGGGYSFPRYLQHVRPGSIDTVLEVDGQLVDLVAERLGPIPDGISVELGDARLKIDEFDAGRFDLVVGDAFGSLTVPWHLTTIEFITEVERVLATDGVYVMNLIDHVELRFVRAELATVRDVFDHVTVIAPPQSGVRRTANNFVLVASNAALPNFDIDPVDGIVLDTAAMIELIGDAAVLTDDFAPVDQLQQ